MSIIGGKRSLSKGRESSVVGTTKLLDRFEIVLDNPEEVYFAGQEITGKVIIECSEPKQLNEVLLEVKGRARSYWTQSRKTCSANEAYFCEQFNTTYTHKLPKNTENDIKKISICEDKKQLNELQQRPTAKTSSTSVKSDPKKSGRTLPPGVHQIPFSYTLPKNLPSSFEGDYGFVRYTCRAICERPWDFDIVCFRAFTVIGIEDLNHEAEVLSLPLETRSTQPVSLFCMKMGTIQTELRVAKGGYTPGEAIRVTLNIQNGSRRSIRNVAICLCQIVNYRSKTFDGAESFKHTRHIVQQVNVCDKIRRGTEFHWKDKPVLVPSIPPRMVTKCKLIDVSYCLELQFNSPKFNISLPIVIGTIPILPGILKNFKNNNGTVKRLIEENNKDLIHVTVTDETGKTLAKNGKTENEDEDCMDPETEQLRNQIAKKRVRMPSSVLSELYPKLASPYYKEFYLGPVPISDDKERKFHFGKNRYAPKYPFYE